MERLWASADSAYRTKLLESLPVDPSVRLLDVGCDDGAWTEQLRQRVTAPPDQVHGLEIVSQRANLARARGFDVRAGDLEDRWPFADDSMDIVHANQIIEHVKRLDHFVEELNRVLVPGGLALVCTENLASWHNVGALALGYQPFSVTNISNLRPIGNRFALHAGEEPAGESWQHIHVVTLTALRDLFVAHGLVVESSWGAGYHPLPRRLASGLAALDPRHAHFIAIAARAR
jgi:SAM-dependent methyltransferase